MSPNCFYENCFLCGTFLVQIFSFMHKIYSISLNKLRKLLKWNIFNRSSSPLWEIRTIYINFDILFIYLLTNTAACFQNESDSFLLCLFSVLFFLAFVDVNSRRTKWLEPFFCLKSFSFMGRLISWPTFAFIYTGVIPAEGKRSYYH